jgi:hypothetical protein
MCELVTRGSAAAYFRFAAADFDLARLHRFRDDTF